MPAFPPSSLAFTLVSSADPSFLYFFKCKCSFRFSFRSFILPASRWMNLSTFSLTFKYLWYNEDAATLFKSRSLSGGTDYWHLKFNLFNHSLPSLAPNHFCTVKVNKQPLMTKPKSRVSFLISHVTQTRLVDFLEYIPSLSSFHFNSFRTSSDSFSRLCSQGPFWNTSLNTSLPASLSSLVSHPALQ